MGMSCVLSPQGEQWGGPWCLFEHVGWDFVHLPLPLGSPRVWEGGGGMGAPCGGGKGVQGCGGGGAQMHKLLQSRVYQQITLAQLDIRARHVSLMLPASLSPPPKFGVGEKLAGESNTHTHTHMGQKHTSQET